jgi:hypothetical protein
VSISAHIDPSRVALLAISSKATSPSRRERRFGKTSCDIQLWNSKWKPLKTSVHRWGRIIEDVSRVNGFSEARVTRISQYTRFGHLRSTSKAAPTSRPPSASPFSLYTEWHSRRRRVSCDHFSGSAERGLGEDEIRSVTSSRVGICNVFAESR